VYWLSHLQAFTVPVEERRFREISEQQFGERGREQAKICADIMSKTGSVSCFLMDFVPSLSVLHSS
jgi:hypothetical protein